jgi:hypothetical protein
MDERAPVHDMSSGESPGSIRADGAWIALFLALVTLLQWYMPYPVDDDTAYHFSVGQLLGKYGLLKSFPWTRFSWQFDHYADKEFLFHLLFVPLGGLGFVTASRVVGVFAGTLIPAALYLVLRAERVRHAGVWSLLPLGTSIFVYRFAQVRPHLLSIALALVLVWAYARGRLRILAIVAVIYPLTYVAFWQIPLILIVAVESARRLAREPFRWQPLVTVTAGIAAGVALHPNALNLLAMNWIHMTDVLLRNAWGGKVEFNMGEEFDPFSVADLARFLLVALLMAGAALVTGWRDRRERPIPMAYAIAALLFGILTLRTNRFLEYFVPFSALALATVSRSTERRWLAPALLGIALLYALAFGRVPVQNLGSWNLRNWYMEPEVVQQLATQIPAGSRVFTCGWEYTGSLLLNLPERQYMVALDPTLMYARDPRQYDLWYRTLLDAPADAAAIVRQRFDSRFVVCQDYPALWPFFNALAAGPGVKTLLSNGKWLLFDLGEAAPAAGR